MTERLDAVPAVDAATTALAACPSLVSVDGPWHGVTPSRAHRCRLLAEGRPTLERQRDHCLVAAHVECPTWLEVHGTSSPPGRPGPFVPTTPVVLEGPGMGMPAQGSLRRLAAPATVVVVGAALGALLLSRGPLAPGTSGAGDDGPSSMPSASAAPASVAPSAAPTAAPTPGPTPPASPAPSAAPRTYRIKAGDTLSGIAAAFGTTVKKIAVLNGITNPSLIRVGQVIKIP